MKLYQLHLPSEVRAFTYETPPTRMDEAVAVFDCVFAGEAPTYCRSYVFFDQWLSVFVTFDEHLALKPATQHAFAFAFNCDITTPHYRQGECLFTTDLCIDVLVGVDGKDYRVTDEDELTRRFEQGEFGRSWYEGAMREVDRLSALLKRDEFVGFLNRVEPFPRAPTETPAPRMERFDIGEIEFRWHPSIPRFG